MHPFTYPVEDYARRHGPQGYAAYERYRDWVRDEFSFRCIYCLHREKWPKTSPFELDHIHPQSKYPDQATEYDNLVLACRRCNLAKGDSEVSDPLSIGQFILVNDDGSLSGTTAEASELIEVLALNAEDVIAFRRAWIETMALARERNMDLFKSWMGFPEDLPNLSKKRPPDGNLRPDGKSWFDRRRENDLPEWY